MTTPALTQTANQPTESTPLCSWRLENNPDLELRISKVSGQIWYSVYDHDQKVYWQSQDHSSKMFTFTQCIWKNSKSSIESRLFKNTLGSGLAVLVSANLEKEKIKIQTWKEYPNDFLISRDPVISADADAEGIPILQKKTKKREVPRALPYEPTAEEGMMRYLKTQEGEQIVFQGNPIKEKVIKVWPGDRDIHLIKVYKSQGEIICRVFDWRNQRNPEVRSRFAPSAEPRLPCTEHRLPNIDDVIEYTQRCTPQLETVNNEEVVTFYKEHPLLCFMPDYYDLSRTDAASVQRWVYNQFYRKDGENIDRFEYTNFVSTKRIEFSFGKKMQIQSRFVDSPKVDTWYVEIKRQASWALQLPVGIGDFFAGMFLASAQNPLGVDKAGMKRVLQGVPMLDPERNKIIDDFAVELGACSVIHFYIACDRSQSQLEVNGRVFVANLGNAGRSVRSTVIHSAEGIANLLRRVHIEDVNRGLENAARLAENANRVRNAWDIVRGNPPQANQANQAV